MSDVYQRTILKTHYSDLDAASKALIRMMQWLNFGDICDLPIAGGKPNWGANPGPTFRRKAKMIGEGMPRMEMDIPDFPLKDAHMTLLAYMEYIGDGYLEKLVVHNGIPFMCEFQDYLR